MPNIDTLSIQFNANGTERAIKNIKSMGYAVRNLAQSVKSIDASKLSAFTSSMETLKKSIPTNAQTGRMVAFSNAVKDLSAVIGSANIGGFSKDMATLGDAVNTFKKSSVNSITNAVTAMQNLQAQTQATAQTVNNAIPKKSQPVSMNNDKGNLPNINTTVAELDKVGSRVDAIKSKFKGIFVPTKQFKTLEEQANKVANKYDELRSKMQEALKNGSMTINDSGFKKQSAELDALRQQYNDLILKQKELAQSGGGIVLNPTLKSSLDAFHKGFSSVTNIIKNGFVAGIRHANSAVKSFASHIKKSAVSLKNTVTGGHKATDMAKKFANELLRVSKMLKLMITRMALRAVIKEVGNGFKSLALHSEEFNNSMSSLINGSKKLGYSFAAMVSPLINALAPAIVYVINLLTKLINIIQQVFGALTGATTWNKAKDFTESWADNIQEANKGAKELKKTVLGFDELNQLQEKTSGGGGNDITDMFETMQIDPKWKEFADWLKDMWKLGDFTKLGEKIGKSLRSLLESIPWEDIRNTSHKLGESLATLINGFVEVERLGYDIGYTIAQSVNTVFEFLNGFVHKLHWDSIGKFIADTFNGFFENIDWVLIKDTVVTGMAGIAKAIQNFIDEFHWDNISDFIVNGIDTITSGILAFVDGIDWLDLGKKIGEQIKKSVEGIDWYQVGEAMGGIIQAAVDWVAGLLETMPSVETLIQKATDLMHGLFDRVDFEQMGANLGAIMQRVYDFLTGFWEENGDEIKGKVKEFFKGFWDQIDKEDLKNVLATILEVAIAAGIASAGWTALKIILAEKLKALITGAATSEAAAAGATEAGTSLGAAIGSALITGVLSVLAGNWLIEAVQGWWSDLIIKGMEDAGYSQAEIDAQKKDLDYLEERYDGLTGKVRIFKDAFTGFKNVEFPSEKVENLGIVVEDLRQPVIKIQDDFNQFGQTASKAATDVNSALKSVNYDNAKKSAKQLGTDTTKVFNDLKITVEKDTGAVQKSVNSIDFKPLNQNVATLDGDTKKAFEGIKANSETLSKAINDSTKEGFESAKKNSEVFTKDVVEEFAGAQKEISGSVQTMAENTDKSMDDIKKTVVDDTTDINKSFDIIKDAMSEKNWTFDGVAKGLKETFRKARLAIKEEWNQVANTLNGEHKVGEQKVKIDLPKFATGGFPEDGLFMANHHELVGSFSNGKTAVANNGQIIAGIETGVYAAVSKALSQNNGSSQYIANEIIVDGDVIARTVSKAQDRQNRRFSPATT